MEVIFSSTVNVRSLTNNLGLFKGAKSHLMIDNDCPYKPTKWDIIHDNYNNVTYSIIEVHDKKSITIAPWGKEQSVEIRAGHPYLVIHTENNPEDS